MDISDKKTIFTDKKFCRLCSGNLFNEPHVKIENISRAAQWFPNNFELDIDKPINLEVYQCAECNLIQLNIHPVNYYKEVITAASYSRKMYDFREKQALKFIKGNKLMGKKVMQFGCGDGYFLNLIKKAGAIPYGLEASNSINNKITDIDIKIINGYPSYEYIIEDGPFDAFISINCLEHSPDPNEYLQGIYNNVSEDSLGLVEVPSLEKIIEKKNFYDWIPDHLSYFSSETLSFALEKNGFKVLDVSRVWGGDDIVALVQKSESVNKIKSLNTIKNVNWKLWDIEKRRFIKSFREIINNELHRDKKIGIWGASHQALTILSMSMISGISYVIDAATFKQEKLTPVSHIPIKNPKELMKNPVDIMIVMAAGYTDEVISQLQKKYMFKGKIGVLENNRIKFI